MRDKTRDQDSLHRAAITAKPASPPTTCRTALKQ